MGTNFYARKKLSVKERRKLHDSLDDFLDSKIDQSDFDDILSKEVSKIHLGKRSYGWQFLWQSQPNYYQDNLASIMEFLLSGDYEIVDEYGETFTFIEFLENEIGRSLYTGYTHSTYSQDHPEKMIVADYTSSDGLRFSNLDFS